LLFFLVLCCACSSEDPYLHQEIQKDEKLMVDLPPFVNRSNVLIKDFSSDFKGKLGDQTLSMTLVKVGETLTGKYLLQGSDVFWDLNGTVDHNGDFTLHHLDKNGLKKGLFAGRFVSDEMQGFWAKAGSDQQTIFVLKEVVAAAE
jgi:hypothetical protein